MSVWTTHFASLDPTQDWVNELSYMTSRSNSVLSQVNAQISPVGFARTTTSPLTVSSSTATVAGTGWVNVRGIRRSGTTAFLPTTWTGANLWQVSVPVPPGTTTVTLEAVNFSGAVVGTTSLAVNNTTSVTPATAANTVVSEIMYHPAGLSSSEAAAGFTDPDQFEYLEVMNIGLLTTNFTGVRFTGGIEYDFVAGTQLPAGERLVIVRDRAAFLHRHPVATNQLAAGAFLNTTGLSNGGEELQLSDAGGSAIKNFAYDDLFPWPESADGTGDSVVLVAPRGNPDHGLAANWRSSASAGGSPGSGDAVSFSGTATNDADRDGVNAFVEHAIGTSDTAPNSSSGASDAAGTSFSIAPDGHLLFHGTRNLAADDVLFEAQLSTDLTSWNPAAMVLISEVAQGTGKSTLTWRSSVPVTDRTFTRLNFRMRPGG